MMPLTLATKMESNGIVFAKMILMIVMASLQQDEPNEVKWGQDEKNGRERR